MSDIENGQSQTGEGDPGAVVRAVMRDIDIAQAMTVRTAHRIGRQEGDDDEAFREPTDEELADPELGELVHDELEERPKRKPVGVKAERDEVLGQAVDDNDLIGLYIKEIGAVPLLTKREEVDLAKRILQGKQAREELGNHHNLMTDELRRSLADRVQDGHSARKHLIEANTRLVISVAKKYMGRGVQFQDLIQAGNVGLIRAVAKFDYRRGHKFSTYTTWWIRQAVTRVIADQGRTIRVPVHMNDHISRMLRRQHELLQKLGRDPSEQELADALGVNLGKLREMKRASRHPLSLELPVGDEGGEEDSVLGDFVSDEDVENPMDAAAYAIMRKKVAEVMDVLAPREARILGLRYGLFDGEAYTLEEIGSKMGVTRERVRQIEAQALNRLRHPAVRGRLKDLR